MKVDTAGDKASLAIGREKWPFPIPVARGSDGKWRFDTAAGVEEFLNRRVGENELSTIETLLGLVEAQREYASVDWTGDDILQFAARLVSSPGKLDGLYWPATEGAPVSPLGPLVAQAQAKGYSTEKKTGGAPTPYLGYFYKPLTGQGAAAPGGRYSYLINGRLLAGFAYVAYPAAWGKSGVMTFIVNQRGRVYQKNIGSKTGSEAAAMTVYNPDNTWTLVAAGDLGVEAASTPSSEEERK
jgi:hypothetical protein